MKVLLKQFWPTGIFLIYTVIVLAEVVVIFGVLEVKWAGERFFLNLGFWGDLLWYPIATAGVLAINPLVYGFGLVKCGGTFISLCFPSLAGTILNLIIILILVFLLNLFIVKVWMKL